MSDFNNAEECSCSVCGVSREGGLDVKYVEQYTFLFQLTALAIKSPSCCCCCCWVRCVSACGLRSTLCSELRLVSCRQIKPLTFNLLLQSQPLPSALMKPRNFWGAKAKSCSCKTGRVTFFSVKLAWCSAQWHWSYDGCMTSLPSPGLNAVDGLANSKAPTSAGPTIAHCILTASLKQHEELAVWPGRFSFFIKMGENGQCTWKMEVTCICLRIKIQFRMNAIVVHPGKHCF